MQRCLQRPATLKRLRARLGPGARLHAVNGDPVPALRRLARERAQPGGDAIDVVEDGQFAPHMGSDGWAKEPAKWIVDDEALIINREFWDVFHACLSGLPSRQAAAFVLRMMEDVDAERVCQDLEITATNLWVMLHRARCRLRACLEENWFAP